MIYGVIYVTVFHVGLLHAVSIFRIGFCDGLALFYKVPFASRNLWRSAFYTVKTMVFTHSAFSEKLFFLLYLIDVIIDFPTLLPVVFQSKNKV